MSDLSWLTGEQMEQLRRLSFMTVGQVSDYTRAAALLDDMLKAQWLPSDRGCDADWFRQAQGNPALYPGSAVAQRAGQTRQMALSAT